MQFVMAWLVGVFEVLVPGRKPPKVDSKNDAGAPPDYRPPVEL
jgi:hypothetical protein